MPGRRPARSGEEKALRASRILESARSAWAGGDYARVSVQEIAEGAGVAKGTVFLYYPTKEALGVAVLRELLAEWWGDLAERLSGLERPCSPSTVAAAVRRSLEGREQLFRLLGMLASVLEENAGDEAVLDLRGRLMEGARRIGGEFEGALPFLRPVEAVEAALTMHAILIGVHHVAAGRYDRRLAGSGLAPFRSDVPGAVGRTLRIQLEGARAMAALASAPAP